MLLEIHLLVKWMEIFIVDLKCIMTMAEYDIVGNVAVCIYFKIDINAERTCRRQRIGKRSFMIEILWNTSELYVKTLSDLKFQEMNYLSAASSINSSFSFAKSKGLGNTWIENWKRSWYLFIRVIHILRVTWIFPITLCAGLGFIPQSNMPK